MQKNDFFKSMQHVNFEPTCTCQKVVPHKLLLSLQSCACWSESVVGSPRSHKCLTGTPTLVRYRTLTGTRGVCRISNYLGAPRTHPIQTDKLTRDVLVDLRHFFLHWSNEISTILIFEGSKKCMSAQDGQSSSSGVRFSEGSFFALV